jgi:hypothetical protein
MKCFYWNIRGLANPSSKLALKNLFLESKPDIYFIVEPWMNVNRLSQRWLHRLGLKLFAVNNRLNNSPNLWCFCSLSLNPTLLNVDDQHISLTVELDGKSFGIAAVYASTCYLHRRNLWNSLSQTQSQHLLPWCFLGDFNTSLALMSIEVIPFLLDYLCLIFKIGLTLIILSIFKPTVLSLLGLMVEEIGTILRKD